MGGRGRSGAAAAAAVASVKRIKVDEYISTFKVGCAVEVSSEDKGLRGSWYTATVITPLSPDSLKIQLQYHNLVEGDDDSNNNSNPPLREHVDALLIRPIPPVDPNPVFRLMDDVDAFHNEGWWEGVVTIIHPRNHYSVFFRSSREQIIFPASHLRIHREWQCLPTNPNHWRPPLQLHSLSSSSSSSSSRPKRKNGDDNNNVAHSPPGTAKKMTKTGRRYTNSPAKQPAPAATGNRSVTMLPRTKQAVCNNNNGNHKKHPLTINGTIKDPRTRASTHTGGRATRK